MWTPNLTARTSTASRDVVRACTASLGDCSMNDSPQALITGGMGFVGSHLAEALLAAGHRVTVLDTLSTGQAENLAHLSGHERLRCVVGDVSDRRLLAPLVEESHIVYHLAAAVGVRLIVEEPVRSLETNILGT